VRTHNEDSLIVQAPLYAVADGMGGHAAGEVASEIAVRTMSEKAPLDIDAEALASAVRAANKAVIDAVASGEGKPGMGTTLTAAILVGTNLLLAQVGDSRAYLLHNGGLQQLTRDHSFVEELVEIGEITRAEAAVHPKRSLITRALGSDVNTEPDIYELEVAPGDRLLLCSDGLSTMVSDETICDILMQMPDAQQAADTLIAQARQAGGHDNITAIVVDVRDTRAIQKRERKRKRHVKLGIITFLIVLVLLIAGAVGGVYYYADNSAYLIDDGGYVAVYKGLPGDILPGISLEWYQYTSDVKTSSLMPTVAQRLKNGIQAGTLDDANSLLDSYRSQIAAEQPDAGATSAAGASAAGTSASSSASSSAAGTSGAGAASTGTTKTTR
jgi:protein phosphatase